MLARTALLLSAGLQVGCFAGICPPSRSEIGTTVIAGGGRPESGLRFASGVHLASGQTSRERRFDIGAGVVYERLAAPPPAASEERALGAAPAPDGERVESIEARGSYVDVAAVVQRGPWHRSWLGARSEVMRQEGPDGSRAVGATYARVAWETYTPARAMGGFSDRSGAFGAGFAYGAFAIGLFLESGVRYAEGEKPAFVAIGGMSVRMPWLGGFVIDPTPKW